MAKFTDRLGREWLVELDVTRMRQVKKWAQVDLFAALDDQLSGIKELVEDLSKLCDVLYVICSAECEERGLTDEDFGRGLAGDTIESAAEAFVEALLDFFPNRNLRTRVRRLFQWGVSLADDSADAISNANVGSSPDLSASTPDHSV